NFKMGKPQRSKCDAVVSKHEGNDRHACTADKSLPRAGTKEGKARSSHYCHPQALCDSEPRGFGYTRTRTGKVPGTPTVKHKCPKRNEWRNPGRQWMANCLPPSLKQVQQGGKTTGYQPGGGRFRKGD